MRQAAQKSEYTEPLSCLKVLRPPIIVIGNGPAGMRFVQELLRRQPDASVVIYGEERHPAYNRVRLSHLLAGEASWDDMSDISVYPPEAVIEERIGVRVRSIDPVARILVDSEGCTQSWSQLILATGSSPHVPVLPGMTLEGIFTFRNLDDAARLLARQARSHHTVVLGGGLLGIEAARAMQRGGTRVTLIEHGDRLLGVQLDATASRLLEQSLAAFGIDVVVGDGVRRFLGDVRVEGVSLLSGREIACDTVILATGIRPRIELARAAGLAFNRGIRVDDMMRTSAPDIYAIGECAEHRERVYGVVAPGLEQAAVAASALTGNEAHYTGSLAAARLKVAGCPVFSTGLVGMENEPAPGRDFRYIDEGKRIYRRLVVHRWRLVGAIGVGTWAEDVRLQQAVARRDRVWPWQLWRFHREGTLWPADEGLGVQSWAASATVCQCNGVTRGSIDQAIARGASSVGDVGQATGAGTVCGSCRPLLQTLVGADSQEPEPGYRTMTVLAVVAFITSLLLLLAPPVPYPDSVQVPVRWDALWRDGLLKQVTGFSVLGLFAVGLLVSLRKRWPRLREWGRYEYWRLAHMVLGLLVIGALLLHTGGRLGSGLNLALMLAFGLTLMVGAVAAGIIGQAHRLRAGLVNTLRRQSLWWHILLFWPVPVLLAFHVLKGYWF